MLRWNGPRQRATRAWKFGPGHRGERECGARSSTDVGIASGRGERELVRCASAGFLPLAIQIISLAACALLAFSTVAFALDQAETSRAETSQGQLSDADKTSYAEALAYCRGNVPRPMALRLDRRVLCFDGMMENPIDPLTIYNLAQGGLFVIRSAGGEIRTAMGLANLLLGKRATVIINDYCFANCANYLSIASLVTFVPKDSLLAWRNVIEAGECAGFSETREAGAPHLGVGPCPSEIHDGRRNEYVDQLRYNFYSIRARGFRRPPESIAIRRILKRK